MFGSSILEMAAGLALVYLLLSLLVSAINEVIIGHLAHMRSTVLEDQLNQAISLKKKELSSTWEWFDHVFDVFTEFAHSVIPRSYPEKFLFARRQTSVAASTAPSGTPPAIESDTVAPAPDLWSLKAQTLISLAAVSGRLEGVTAAIITLAVTSTVGYIVARPGDIGAPTANLSVLTNGIGVGALAGVLVVGAARAFRRGIAATLQKLVLSEKPGPIRERLRMAFNRVSDKSIEALEARTAGNVTRVRTLAERILDHPLIESLAANGRTCPGYIPSRTFVDAVLGTLLADKIRDGIVPLDLGHVLEELEKQGDERAKLVLRSILIGAKDLAEAKIRIEAWFNTSMDGVTEAYKRATQTWLLIWAAVVVVALNADSIELTKRLLVDSTFRSSLANAATNPRLKEVLTATNGNQLHGLIGEIDRLHLPFGWTTNVDLGTCPIPLRLTLAQLPKLQLDYSDAEGTSGTNGRSLFAGWTFSPPSAPKTANEWWLKAAGLALTMIAVSQGAPFWFELLNKFINLRAAGPKPKPVESPEGKAPPS
jgi:hypothetical protein